MSLIRYGTIKCQTDGCENELHYFGRHIFGGNIDNDGIFCFKCLNDKKGVKNEPDVKAIRDHCKQSGLGSSLPKQFHQSQDPGRTI